MIPQLVPVLSGGFSLDAFMASQSAGFWYNFLRDDTMFQEDVGPTPADEPNEVIGLALSQRLWGGQTRTGYLAGQPELWANQTPSIFDFSGTVGSYNAGSRTMTNLGATFAGYPRFRFNLGLTAGRVYRVLGRIDGSRAAIATVRLADSGFLNNASYNSTTGIFDGYTTAAIASIEFLTNLASADTGAILAEISVREVSQIPATQSTTSFKPKFQTTGAAFDGTDDNLLTNYTAGSGANTLIAKVVVPASISATQVIAGARNSTDTRSLIAFDASGRFGAGVGAVGNGTIRGDTDFRSQTVVVGVAYDGSTVRLFEPGAVAYEAAQSGVATTTTPYRIGAFNDNGAASLFFGGSIQQILGWQGGGLTDLARFQQIANALGA